MKIKAVINELKQRDEIFYISADTLAYVIEALNEHHFDNAILINTLCAIGMNDERRNPEYD